MEDLKLDKKENMPNDKEFVIEKIGLIGDDKRPNIFVLNDEKNHKDNNEIKRDLMEVNNFEFFLKNFENIKIIEPDKICRPEGDTTLFTTAGVQHVETILRDNDELKKELFAITQPVIRSQFTDRVKEGTSTSFVNFSVESIDSNLEEYISFLKNLINLILDQGVNPKNLDFSFKEDSVKWKRRFSNMSTKIFINNIEIGECVFIYNFPVSQENNISITDLGFGVERLNWATKSQDYYFSDFEDLYKLHTVEDKDAIASIIDAVRSMVLITGEGIKGSNNNYGYRLRQFSKRFVERNKNFQLDIENLVHNSLEYWQKWGYKPALTETEIISVIKIENERNFNAQFLSELEKIQGKRLRIEVNQTTTDFINQARFSVSEEDINYILKILI